MFCFEIFNDPPRDASDGRNFRQMIRMEPSERFELRSVRMSFTGNVICVKSEHERVRERPALAGEVADIADGYAGFLHNFACNGFLDIFSGFNEP